MLFASIRGHADAHAAELANANGPPFLSGEYEALSCISMLGACVLAADR